MQPLLEAETNIIGACCAARRIISAPSAKVMDEFLVTKGIEPPKNPTFKN